MKAKRETVVQERERQLAHRKVEQELREKRNHEEELRRLELEERVWFLRNLRYIVVTV